MISDKSVCLVIARKIVMGKLTNMKVVVQRRARKRKEERLRVAARRITDRIKSAASAGSMDELLGIEGSGTRDYFDVFDLLLNKNSEFTFDKRTRRPPKDPVNSLLSFVYTILASEMVSAIQTVGLDPYFGFYHQLRYGRPCLALDLMEEFRTSIGDLVVLSLINRRQITESDFYESSGGWFLKNDAKKTFYAEYERRKNEKLTHAVFGYKVTYRQAMELQARLLAKVIVGEIKDYVSLTLR
jgi:CRISPR-associated protein Cas1